MNPRILLVTKNFPPMVGGMERLMGETLRQLRKYYTVDLVVPANSNVESIAPGRIIVCRLKPSPIFVISALIKSVIHAAKYRPAICMAGSGVTAPIAVIVGILFKIKSVIYVHGLDLIYPNPVYQKLFVPCIRLADTVIANSKNTAEIAVKVGVSPERIRVQNPGTTIPAGRCQQDGHGGIDHLPKGLTNNKIVLSFGRIVPRKGIAEFLQYAFPSVLEMHPDVLFVITGPCEKKYQGILENIEHLIAQNHWHNNVLLTGKLGEEDLIKLLNMSRVFVFPVIDQPGDVEGFGMVAIEAASYGMPTVAFRVGGVTDAIDDGKSGYLVEPGDYASFANFVNVLIANQADGITWKTCRTHAEKFSWDKYGENMKKILDDIPQV